MRKLLAIAVLMLMFCGLGLAQSSKSLFCPKTWVDGPAGITNPGDIVRFVAFVEGRDPETIEYNWSVAGGDIVHGQGSIVLDVLASTESNYTITATVEFVGLPDGCPSKASETAEVAVVARCGLPLDQYGDISSAQEKAILANLAVQMNNSPADRALFVFQLTKKQSSFLIRSRVRRIKKYMGRDLGIADKRLKFVFYESDSYTTGIFLMPPGVTDPYPEAFDSLEKLRAKNKTKSRKINGEKTLR